MNKEKEVDIKQTSKRRRSRERTEQADRFKDTCDYCGLRYYDCVCIYEME